MNRAVLDADGKLLAIVDLLEVVSGTYGEYNGAQHRSRDRHRRDVEREESLRAVGLEGFTIVAGDSRAVQVQRMTVGNLRVVNLAPESPTGPKHATTSMAGERVSSGTGKMLEVDGGIQEPNLDLGLPDLG